MKTQRRRVRRERNSLRVLCVLCVKVWASVFILSYAWLEFVKFLSGSYRDPGSKLDSRIPAGITSGVSQRPRSRTADFQETEQFNPTLLWPPSPKTPQKTDSFPTTDAGALRLRPGSAPGASHAKIVRRGHIAPGNARYHICFVFLADFFLPLLPR